MNKVVLSGRLTKDAEVRYSAGGQQKAVARVTLAVNRKYAGANGEKEADFISCVAFGRQAEFLEKFGTKGIKFEVAGRICTDSYTGSDSKKVYTTDVVVEEIEFAEKKAQ